MIRRIAVVRVVRRLVLFISCLLLVSCGGSSVSSDSEGGISGTGISVGRVASISTSGTSGNSQVAVNGTTLEIDAQTQIFVDEQPASESDLGIGNVVRVQADFTNQTASRIDYVETARGPLTAAPVINPDTLSGTLNVLGQTVLTNASTIFSNVADVSMLTINDQLDVSGIRDASGNIVASFIEKKSPPVSEYRVVGIVANVTATTFAIGALTIDYSSADTSSLTGGVPTAGAEVRVRGSAATFNSGTNTFTASRVSDNTLSIGASADDSVEIEGIVTLFSSIANFEVNGLIVDGGGATIEGGTAASIALNTSLEVEGVVNASGVLIASEIDIRRQNSVRIEASVDSVNTGVNTLVVLGITLRVDSNTQFEDDSTAELSPFSLQNISPGNWVEVRGYIDNGSILLTRVERDDPDTDVRLQAPVDAGGVDKVGQTVTIQGITVLTDSNTEFEDSDDMPLLAGPFFDLVMEGDVVKAQWENFTGTNVPADELSIEN